MLAALMLITSCAPAVSLQAEPEAPEPHLVRNREASLPIDAVKKDLTSDNHPLHLHSSEYYYPISLLGAVNTAGFEELPCIVPDGSVLYFYFKPVAEAITDPEIGTWVSYLCSDGVYGRPEFVSSENYRALGGAVSLNGDVPWLNPENGSPGNGISADDVDRDLNLELLRKVIPYVNAAGWSMSPDGASLFFHTEEPAGKGGSDIWLIEKKDGRWQKARNFAEINTELDESFPFITPDGKELWFIRSFNNRPAIYRSVRYDIYWLKPQLIIANYANTPSLDCNGNIYFAHSFTDANGIVESDIFVSYKKKKCG